jgi:nucleoside-diphosphate-sugar epimerase
MEPEPGKIELFVMGATGFIGKEVVKEAVARGYRVKALARSAEKANELAAVGALTVSGDAGNPTAWVREVAGCDAIIDLIQPELPRRIGLRAIRQTAARRQAITSRLLAALLTIPIPDRPLLLSVSGLDDLTPDEHGRVHAGSPLRTQLTGFGHIGIPVRRSIEKSGVARAFAYLATVYGPGKAFAKTIFPQLAAGRFRMAGRGDNRMPLVHVQDAARALVHLAALDRGRLSGRSFVIADGHQASMAEFLGCAADCLGARRPRSVPLWLARPFAGTVLCETLTRDIVADPAGIIETGFSFLYPSYREGLPPTLQRLGYGARRRTGILDSRALFRTLFILAIGALIAENCFYFPLSVPWMKGLAGGAPILDMRLGYSENAVYQLFDALGETGRRAYLNLLWTVDLILPALFGLFLSTAIRRGAFRKLRWMPFLASACDYCENIGITFLLLQYPVHAPAMVGFSSTLTVLKHALYAAGAILAIAGLVGIRRPARFRTDDKLSAARAVRLQRPIL